jgi:hypothetical protein
MHNAHAHCLYFSAEALNEKKMVGEITICIIQVVKNKRKEEQDGGKE